MVRARRGAEFSRVLGSRRAETARLGSSQAALAGKWREGKYPKPVVLPHRMRSSTVVCAVADLQEMSRSGGERDVRDKGLVPHALVPPEVGRCYDSK